MRQAASRAGAPPARRTVTLRSPSWVGSLVKVSPRVREGLGSLPKVEATRVKARRWSNRPLSTSTALSGW